MNNSYKKAMDKIELSDELKAKIVNNASKSQTHRSSKFRPAYIRRITGIAACFVFCVLSYYTVTNYYTPSNINIVSVDIPESTPDNGYVETDATSVPAQTKPVLKAAPNNTKPVSTTPPTYKKPKADNSKTEAITAEIATGTNPPATENTVPPFAKEKVITEDNINNSVNNQATTEPNPTESGYEIKAPQKVPAEYEETDISVVDDTAVITYQSENDTITYKAAKGSEDLRGKNDTYEFMEIVNVNNTDIVLKGKAELYYSAAWSDDEESFSITSDNGVEKSILIDMASSIGYPEQNNTDIEQP